MVAAIVEKVKGDIGPVARPKRTRRPEAKVEPELLSVAEEPPPVEPPVEPEPVKETAPTVATLNESDVVATGAAKPDKITCNARGKM